jgi:hypothetical protein
MIPRMLGKLPPRHDDRTLQLSKYVEALPHPPAACDYTNKVPSWPMYGNDTLGDCVAAAGGHMVEQWSYEAGKPFLPSQAEIVAFYQNSGYNPADPSTDQGWDLLSALKIWRTAGIAGHIIAAFLQLQTGNLEQLKQAVYLFGNAYIGLALPLTAQGQALWSVPASVTGDGAPGSWGGHCVPIVGYAAYKQTCVTWGALLNLTPAFYSTYSDEAYAVLSQDWVDKNAKAPNGFDLDQLAADLAEVTA